MASQNSSWRRRIGPAARALGMLIAFGWIWFVAAWARTQGWGVSPGALLIAVLFGIPVAVLPVLGLRLRTGVRAVVIILLLAVVAAEVPAAIEEAAFRRKHRDLPATAPAVFEGRFWPFRYHHLYYEPATRRWGAGD